MNKRKYNPCSQDPKEKLLASLETRLDTQRQLHEEIAAAYGKLFLVACNKMTEEEQKALLLVIR